MSKKSLFLALLTSLAFLVAACDPIYKLTATKIKDILDHPRDYEKKEVTVYGTVADQFSLVVIKYFEINDGSGAIKVITDRPLPKRGETLRVTGTVQSVEIGPARFMAIKEKTGEEKKS
jgi:aspartyl/asparaginyl-tRNA synthetase